MKHPRHLWSGAWREESEEARLALDEHGEPITAVTQLQDAPRPRGAPPRPAPHPRAAPPRGGPPARRAANGPPPPGAPPPERRSRLGRRAALIAVPAAAVAIGGYALGVHSSDDGTPASTQA